MFLGKDKWEISWMAILLEHVNMQAEAIQLPPKSAWNKRCPWLTRHGQSPRPNGSRILKFFWGLVTYNWVVLSHATCTRSSGHMTTAWVFSSHFLQKALHPMTHHELIIIIVVKTAIYWTPTMPNHLIKISQQSWGIYVIILPFVDEQTEVQGGSVLLREGRVRIQTQAHQHLFAFNPKWGGELFQG